MVSSRNFLEPTSKRTLKRLPRSRGSKAHTEINIQMNFETTAVIACLSTLCCVFDATGPCPISVCLEPFSISGLTTNRETSEPTSKRIFKRLPRSQGSKAHTEIHPDTAFSIQRRPMRMRKVTQKLVQI